MFADLTARPPFLDPTFVLCNDSHCFSQNYETLEACITELGSYKSS